MGHEATIDPQRLHALVTSVVAARQRVARAQADESRLLADAVEMVVSAMEAERAHGSHHRSRADLPMREVAAELATAMRVTDRTVQRRMGDASQLASRFPATLAAWEEGSIDSAHVNALLDAGGQIDDDDARGRFEARALEVARMETAARLRAVAAAIAAQIDPVGSAERMRRSASDRQVRVFDLDSGQARLLADLPATLAHAMYDRLTRMARTVRGRGGHGTGAMAPSRSEGGDDGATVDDERAATVDDERTASAEQCDPFVTGPSQAPTDHVMGDSVDSRTLDQLRADLLCDLVLAGGAMAHGDGLESITGHVQVTVTARSLAEGRGEIGLLAGGETADAESVRCLAATASVWDRVFTDPLSGAVLGVDSYRPSAELKRFLRARDETCRFPGCRRAARGCDIDHTQDAAHGGPTRVDNLAHLCRRHHTLKHESAWTVRQRGGGVLEWRSPLGRLCRDRPPAVVRFTRTDADPPPF